ncbi:putative motility protein [Massilia sp. RP-1-19]|uniref:Putative motility protein n=1 Tax=Massilia polaris TaxID=2728846 RepID=A0A848HL98_9BURK|nr:YjfB family protein [Massilia polaris]NML62004.1 putative motility protein [Massilia polaris]
MDVAAIAKLSSSIAETGNRQEVQAALLKRALQIEGSTATQLIDAVKTVPSVQNLPSNLGNTINTTA